MENSVLLQVTHLLLDIIKSKDDESQAFMRRGVDKEGWFV